MFTDPTRVALVDADRPIANPVNQLASLPLPDTVDLRFRLHSSDDFSVAPSTPPSTSVDNPLITAPNLTLAANVQTINEAIDLNNTSDYYRFTLSQLSGVTLSLTNLSANLNLALLNSDGSVLTANNVVQVSANTGRMAETLNTVLTAGVYYIRVFAGATDMESSYRLNVQASSNNRTDLIWRNPTTDSNTIWQLNGTTHNAYALPNAGNPAWTIAGTADFDRDGDQDILWYNPVTAQTSIWEMNGASYRTYHLLPVSVGTGWAIAGIADFNGDGNLDIFRRNTTTGENAIWQMNQFAYVTAHTFATVAPNWTLEDIADVDGSGDPNLLWRDHSTGQNTVWQLNGFAYRTFYQLPTLAPGWAIAGITNFVGNSSPEIIWRNATAATTTIWQLNGLAYSIEYQLPSVPGDWSVAAASDFDGDGDSEILWRQAGSGQNSLWQLSGAVYSTFALLAPQDPRWLVASAINQAVIADLAGNSTIAALDLGTLSGTGTYRDTVGNTDSRDFYRFNLASAGDINVRLTGLTANADLRLFRDGNGNGMIDAGEEIARSELSGTWDDFLNLRSLQAGTYFLEVYQNGGSTPYTLQLSNRMPSDLLSVEQDIGTLPDLYTITGNLANNDGADVYRFTLGAAGVLNVALTGLTATTDADIRVIRDVNNNGIVDIGDEVARSERGSGQDEAINLRSLAAGSYFLQVYQAGTGNINYALRLSTAAPSNLLPAEADVGILTAPRTINDAVSSADTADVYRFSLNTAAFVTLNLAGLSADANLRLIRDLDGDRLVDDGEVIASSTQTGTTAETLSQALQAGTYFVQVFSASGDTNYTLNLAAATDGAGNTLATARNLGALGGSQPFADYVGSDDPNDYYRFTLNTDSNFSLSLTGLSADADVALIQDANNNNLVDSGGEVIAFSTAGGNTAEAINRVLTAGTYFVRVYQYSGNTNYTLTLSTTTTIPLPPDNAGNTLATARDLGVLTTPRSFSDYVGNNDTNDYYRFTLNTISNFTLTLNGLVADADTQLIRDTNNNGVVDSGEVIAYPWQNGATPETLSIGLSAGTYFIRIFPYSGSTNYNLSVAATEIVLPPGYNPNYGYGLVNAAAAVAQAIGQPVFADVPNLGGDSWNLDMVNAPEVWARGYTGQNIVVAVVDSGVDYNHPDLDASIWVNTDEIAGNGIDDDNNGFIDDVRGWDFVGNDNAPMDVDSHGTHVAGTIAAENNGVGNTGVAYNARIMPVRVLDDQGSGTWVNVASGIRYAADNGANVINLSLGGGYSSEVAAAVQYAAQRGAIVVMAAGNEAASRPGFPASLANEWGIAVGAVNGSNQMASFSNRAGITPLNYVVAPGVNVYSSVPNNSYANFSGTSMATPQVAGVVALLLSANPNLTPAQVISLVTGTANPNGITV